MGESSFWERRFEADEKVKRLGELSDLVSKFNRVQDAVSRLKQSWSDDAFFETRRAFKELEPEPLSTAPSAPRSAILSVCPGAGGEDAEDWARMLALMYEEYAKRRGWKAFLIDDNPRSRTIEIVGKYAHGYLKKESGVHRLLRIFP